MDKQKSVIYFLEKVNNGFEKGPKAKIHLKLLRASLKKITKLENARL